MNDQKSKRPSGDAGMSSREIEASIKRIEDDLYFSPDNIGVRLARIEGKLEHVATREDMDRLKIATRDDMEKLNVAIRDDMEKLNVAIHDDMEKLNVAIRDDMEKLKTDLERQITELKAHSNTQFRWTVGLFVSVAGVIVTVVKLF